MKTIIYKPKTSGVPVKGKRDGKEFVGFTGLVGSKMYVSIAFKEGGVTHCPIDECEEIDVLTARH